MLEPFYPRETWTEFSEYDLLARLELAISRARFLHQSDRPVSEYQQALTDIREIVDAIQSPMN